MLRPLLAVLVCVALVQRSHSAPAPEFLWARTATGPDEDAITSLAVDPSGNCYVAGYFRGATVDFGTTNLINRGSTDAFLSKYDSVGTHRWSRHYGDSGRDDVRQITLDHGGNILVAGRFAGTVNFGTTNLTAAGEDIFLAKISSDGDCIWSVKAGGDDSDFAESICVDGEGNLYVGGFINSTNAIFGPFTISIRPQLVSHPQPDPFIAKYNGSGEVQWVQQISSPGYGYGISVAADSISGVYVTGSFFGVGTFGPTNLTARAKLFLARFRADGRLRWVNDAGDESPGDGSYGTDVVADNNGNVYLTGFFSGPIATFGSLSITNAGTDGWESDLFLAKYDRHGAVHWVKSAGGTRQEYGGGIGFDGAGDVYVVGYFESAVVDFGGILITSPFTNSFGRGSGDGFLAKYRSDGEILSVQQLGGSLHDYLWTTAIDAVGNVFVGGAYSSSDMNYNLPPADWGYDGFIAKFETAVPPRLTLRSTSPPTVELSWSALAERFYLDSASSFQSPLNWQSNAVPVERTGTTNRVTIDTTAQGKLYRLRRNAP